MLPAVLLFCHSSVGGNDWRYSSEHTSELLYLHELVDYDYAPDWNEGVVKELAQGKQFSV